MNNNGNNPFLNLSNEGNQNSLFGTNNKNPLFQNNAPGTNSLFGDLLFGTQTQNPNASISFLNKQVKPPSVENKDKPNPFNIFSAKENDKSKEVEEEKKNNNTGGSLFGNMEQNTPLFSNNTNIFSQNQKNDSTLFSFQSDNKSGDRNFFLNNKKDTENNKKENNENNKDNKMKITKIINLKVVHFLIKKMIKIKKMIFLLILILIRMIKKKFPFLVLVIKMIIMKIII